MQHHPILAQQQKARHVGYIFTSGILEFLKFNLDHPTFSFFLALIHLEPFLIFYFFFSSFPRNHRTEAPNIKLNPAGGGLIGGEEIVTEILQREETPTKVKRELTNTKGRKNHGRNFASLLLEIDI